MFKGIDFNEQFHEAGPYPKEVSLNILNTSKGLR